MDAVEGHESATERIVLAHEPPLRLGPLVIEPAMRRIAHQDGREEILEQRVMQVLVALVRADGAILSRDDLIASCWDGRIVGDDAINRVMSRLRRTADGLGRGIFRIETITKIGYRLVPEGEGAAAVNAPAAHVPAPAEQRRRFRPIVPIALGLLFVLILGLVLAMRWLGGGPGVPTVSVVTETQGGEAGALARDLSADLSRLAGARAADLAIVDASRADAADYVVRIGGQRRGNMLSAELTLVDRASGELLWSARFERAAREQSDMRQQIAVKLGNVLLCTLPARADEARLDLVTLRLFLNYCDRIHDYADASGIALIRQVTQRAPDFARGWAYLAIEESVFGEIPRRLGPQDGPELDLLREAARGHLRRARAIDPTLAETYLAEAFLLDDAGRWAERLALFERGIALGGAGRLHEFRGVELMRVGRMREAVQTARSAIALDPLSPWQHNALVSALVYSGDVGGARTLLEAAERIWPGSVAMRDMRFRFDLRYGDAANALRMLDDPANSEVTGPDQTRESLRAYLRARLDPSPANVEASIRVVAPLVVHRPIDGASAYLQLLGYFGRVDEAYRLLDQPAMRDPMRSGTEILFRPQMRSIRNDRRFMALTHRLGLLHYWRTSGHWPDFCSDPDLPYDCRAEARRLLGAPNRAGPRAPRSG